MKVTNNKSSHSNSNNNNNKRHFNSFCSSFFFPLLNTVMPTGIIYSATPTPLSALWREVWWGQWGRLLDSEVRRWRGVLWPFMQPLWRLLSPPFRMSWMCCTIKLMATAGNEKERRLCGRLKKNNNKKKNIVSNDGQLKSIRNRCATPYQGYLLLVE